MNIFFLYACAVASAQALCDKHVVKMPLEMAQLLCTAYRWLHGQRPVTAKKKKRKTNSDSAPVAAGVLPEDIPYNDHLYKMTHYNHPMAVWVRNSKENFEWTLKHGIALCKEWHWRYDHPVEKEHACMRIFNFMTEALARGDLQGKFPLFSTSEKEDEGNFTVPPQCVGPAEDGYHVKGNTFNHTVQAYRAYYKGAKRDIAQWKKKPERKPEWF